MKRMLGSVAVAVLLVSGCSAPLGESEEQRVDVQKERSIVTEQAERMSREKLNEVAHFQTTLMTKRGAVDVWVLASDSLQATEETSAMAQEGDVIADGPVRWYIADAHDPYGYEQFTSDGFLNVSRMNVVQRTLDDAPVLVYSVPLHSALQGVEIVYFHRGELKRYLSDEGDPLAMVSPSFRSVEEGVIQYAIYDRTSAQYAVLTTALYERTGLYDVIDQTLFSLDDPTITQFLEDPHFTIDYEMK
ncbi:hypothetical protein GOP80_07565 [Planococcaceae bacterium Storch 2/2-2]|nr:hypothetical protein [Planococcaceae bacterium Storch 2/2-2]